MNVGRRRNSLGLPGKGLLECSHCISSNKQKILSVCNMDGGGGKEGYHSNTKLENLCLFSL